MQKHVIGLIMGVLIGNIFGAEALAKITVESGSKIQIGNKVNGANEVIKARVNNIDAKNIDNIDAQSSDLYELSRQAEIAKKQAEIRRIKNGGVSGGDGNNQTVVTGIAIDLYGKKIAWLQFADGGDLAVNIGSKVGSYIVSKIAMNGVTLKGDGRQVFLKRVYSSASGGRSKFRSQSPAIAPSPITTPANNGGGIMVPPIVSNN